VRYAIVLFLLVAGACGPVKPVPDPPPPNPPDPVENADCEAVCGRAAVLGCEWAEPTPRGASCTELCEGVQAGLLPWDLDCRVRAPSCAAMDACER
jgi:hypothetical protein